MLNKNYFSFYPIKSLVHQMNSTTKVLILLLSLLSLLLNSYFSITILFIITFVYLYLTKVPIINYIKIVYVFRFIFFLLILLCAYLKVSLIDCMMIILKIIIVLESLMIITYTTSPIEIANGVDNVINPFNIFFIKTGKLSLFIMMSLKFIPVCLNVTEKILDSQASRGFDYYYRTIIGKLYVITINIPNIIKKAITHNEQIKNNMESKLFDYNKIRVKYMHNKVGILDILLIAALFSNILFYVFGAK